MLCAHAMFKAALFMVVGIIDHATGTRDIRRLAWLGHAQPAAAGHRRRRDREHGALPPFLGFVAKEADFETLLHSASLGACGAFVLAGIVVGSVFTTIYSLRFLWGAFAPQGSSRTQQAGRRNAPPRPRLPRPRRRSWPRPACCSVCGRRRWTACWTPTPTRCPGGADYHLALWHGSGCRCCCRYSCWRSARRRSSVGPGCAGPVGYLPLGNADRIYDAVLRGADVLSRAADRHSPSAARSRRRSR